MPDASQWSLNLGAFSSAAIDYPATPPPGEIMRTCFLLPTAFGPHIHTGSITHPSGATGQFTVQMTEHGRSHVPVSCSNVTRRHNDPNDDVNLYPINWHAWSLKTKLVTGPGLSPMQWNYTYQPSISVHFFPGSTIQYPDCPPLTDCSVPPCQSEACAGSTRTTVNGPDGEWLRYHYGNTYRYNEGKLLKVESGAGETNILRTVNHGYDLSQVAQAYPARYGTSPRDLGDGFTAEYHRPQTTRQTTQQWVVFTHQVDAFNQYAQPTQITRSNTMGFSKSEQFGYWNSLPLWVLGQTQNVYDVSSGLWPLARLFDNATALPSQTYEYGKLVERRSYHTSGTQKGLPYEIYDGGNVKRTRLSNYHRGVPRLVTFHDNTTQSAVVNSRGEISSVSNELGHTTHYQYDAMGRLSQITYPTGDLTAWAPTTLNFTRVASTEYGLPAGHWRLTEATGAYRKITYFDGLWRPVLSREFDNANEAATRRMVQRKFNHRGQETFVSYPQASISSYTALVNGVATTYDTLGREVLRSANSELGLLNTQTSYLLAFRTQVKDPNGNFTTVSYQAYDEPSTDWPRLVQHPLGITTTINRDSWGKPTSITRSGSWTGGHQSFTRTYVYDAHQRLCKLIDPESGATVQGWNTSNQIAWTARGQSLTSPSDCQQASVPTAQRSTHSYDARNRLTFIDHPIGTSDVSYGYFADGALQTAATATSTWSYSYDKRGLLRNETLATNGLSLPVNYSYTTVGHRASVQYPDGATVNWLPNALGQASRAGNFATNASYHRNGVLAGFTYGDGHVYSLALNTRQLPLQRSELRNGVKLLNYAYTYDGNGNVLSVLDDRPGGNETRTLGYDALNRMTQADAPGLLGFETYRYDALDNLRKAEFVGASRADLHITYGINASNNRLSSIELAQTGTPHQHSYSHDARGNHTSGTTSIQAYTRSFNALNQMTAVFLPGQTDYYWYDAHGRRTTVQRNNQVTTQLYSREGQLLYERSPAGVGTRHVYLGGRLVASTTGSTTTWQHTDHLGSPVRRTNAAGTQTGITIFAPYGSLVAGTVSQGPGFTGHVNDTGSGLVYMQQRHYDPIAMRFVSVDPVHVDSGSGGNFNRYWYANNNPVTLIDPDGMMACSGDDFFKCQDQIQEIERQSKFPLEKGSSQSHNASSECAECDEVMATRRNIIQGWGDTLGDAGIFAAKEGAMLAGGGIFGRLIGRVGGLLSFGRKSDRAVPMGAGRSPMHVPGPQNVPTTIAGRRYTGHALDQMQGRGIMPSVVEDTIQRGVQTSGRDGARIYSTEQLRVIINPNGSIKTVFRQ